MSFFDLPYPFQQKEEGVEGFASEEEDKTENKKTHNVKIGRKYNSKKIKIARASEGHSHKKRRFSCKIVSTIALILGLALGFFAYTRPQMLSEFFVTCLVICLILLYFN